MSKVLGTIYSLPGSRRQEPLPPHRWPRSRLLAELARLDAELEALAKSTGSRQGAMQPIGPLARGLLLKAKRKYRNRLARAL